MEISYDTKYYCIINFIPAHDYFHLKHLLWHNMLVTKYFCYTSCLIHWRECLTASRNSHIPFVALSLSKLLIVWCFNHPFLPYWHKLLNLAGMIRKVGFSAFGYITCFNSWNSFHQKSFNFLHSVDMNSMCACHTFHRVDLCILSYLPLYVNIHEVLQGTMNFCSCQPIDMKLSAHKP